MNPVKLAPLGGKSGPETPEESESFDMFWFGVCILSDMFRQDSMRPTARVIMDKLLLGPLMTGAFLGLGLEWEMPKLLDSYFSLLSPQKVR